MKINELKKLRAKVPKYRAVPTTINGKTFASKKEAHRYKELLLLQRGGEIAGLRCQVTFDLNVSDVHICRYVADFVYFDKGVKTVEDVKGFLTKEYKIKKKLMKAIHGIEIKEV